MDLRTLLALTLAFASTVQAVDNLPTTPLKVSILKSSAPTGQIQLNSKLHFKNSADRIAFVAELGVTGGGGGTGDLVSTNNLSDLANSATALGNLGGTIIGKGVFTMANPNAVRFFKVQADNVVVLRTAAEIAADLGAATLAGNNAFSGNNTFSGTNNLTGTTNVSAAFNIVGDVLHYTTGANFTLDFDNVTYASFLPTSVGGTGLNTSAATGFAYVTGGTWSILNATTARTNLGLGTAALISSTAGGDLSGTLPSPTVIKINGVALSGLGTGILKNTTGTGAPSIAVPADFPTLNQNTTGSAATLTTSRNINGTAFNGSADITITAAAGTLTGATLASGVTASSLTSFGASPGISGVLTETNNGLATTTTNGVVLQNTTVSTVGAQVQVSPALTYIAHGWGTSSVSDAAVQFRWNLVPVPAATTPTGLLTLYTKLGAGTENSRVTISDTGALSIGTTAALTAGTIELGATIDTTIARVAAGQISIEGVNVVTTSSTDTLTNKTFDAAATGNVLKAKGYLYLTHPHLVDGTGATLGTTATAIDYGHATFSNSADESANYVEYRLMVPPDIDTSVELRAKLHFRLTAADTAKHRYTLNTVSQADSASATGTVGTPINLDFTSDASGASGDVESVGFTTLTGWAATMTAGRLLVVRLARDGNDATNDTSTVNSTELGLVLEYALLQ